MKPTQNTVQSLHEKTPSPGPSGNSPDSLGSVPCKATQEDAPAAESGRADVLAAVDQLPGVKPKRIQRKRTKGWKMPQGAVYVGRPSKWGNPYGIDEVEEPSPSRRDNALLAFAVHVLHRHAEIRRDLRGKDLACWCPLDEHCHADVLLEIANS